MSKKMSMKHCSLIITTTVLLAFTSCGYHFGAGSAPWIGSTISVPYICGDETGEFTRTLVRELASSGAFQYTDDCGCYRLCVNVRELCDENIGFRYDINKEGQQTTTIIPVEMRTRTVAEFSLVEASSGCVVLGPERVSAMVDFDHEFEGGSDHLNNLSLGQVTDLEASKEVIPGRLGQALAERIVDYLRGAW